MTERTCWRHLLKKKKKKKKQKEHALPQRHNLVSQPFLDTSLEAEDTSCLEADKLVQEEAEG